MALRHLDQFSRLISVRYTRHSQMLGNIFDVTAQPFGNSLNDSEHDLNLPQALQLYVYSLQFPPAIKSTSTRISIAHIRTFHTCACSSVGVNQSLLSSRRGRLSNIEDAKQYVASLTMAQRDTLEQVLQEVRMDVDKMDTLEVMAPSRNQLKLLCCQSALPFIGFGFLDNFIMITVGEYIDWTLGLTLGISTMAAAGLGNMISDLAGLGLADQVEAICLRLGIPDPKLSSIQLKHRLSRWTSLLGRCIGIVIGCTIGMVPLLWIKDPHKDHEHCNDDK